MAKYTCQLTAGKVGVVLTLSIELSRLLSVVSKSGEVKLSLGITKGLLEQG